MCEKAQKVKRTLRNGKEVWQKPRKAVGDRQLRSPDGDVGGQDPGCEGLWASQYSKFNKKSVKSLKLWNDMIMFVV